MYYILMTNGGFASYDQISEKVFEINVTSRHFATSFDDMDKAVQEIETINKVNTPYLQSVYAECVVEIHHAV